MFSVPEEDWDSGLDLLQSRLYYDQFYQGLLYSGLKICENLASYSLNLNIEMQFLVIRGSLVTGNVTPYEDIDIVINTKNRMLLYRYIEKNIHRFKQHIRNRCPNLTRKHPVSIYLPRTPQNPLERNELFKEDPVDLEKKTTQAEQIIGAGLRKSVYKFQNKCLEPIVNTTLKNSSLNSIKAIKLARETGMNDYGIDRNTIHNSTIICQARCLGLILSEMNFELNKIIKARDKLIRERFEETINEIYYNLGI